MCRVLSRKVDVQTEPPQKDMILEHRVCHISSGWFKHIELYQTSSKGMISERARCVEFCHLSSRWFKHLYACMALRCRWVLSKIYIDSMLVYNIYVFTAPEALLHM